MLVVIFQQSQGWSRSIAWGIMGLIVVLISWAALARIDEAIPADGTIEPLDDARKIQAASSGVVQQIYVKNGDRVKAGDLLLRLEATVPKSQLTYLQSTKDSLAAKNRFYRAQMHLSSAKYPNIAGLHLPPEVLALTKSRNALVAENQLYRSEMSGKNIAGLTINQQNRLQSSQNELNSRLTIGKLEIGQVQKQLSANRLRRRRSI